MRKKIFWAAVFTFFTTLVSGLYLAARQQPEAQPSSPGPMKKAAAAAPSIMAVRMHVHDIDPIKAKHDHADDNDHCIGYDPKPSPSPSPTPTPTPLKVEVDLSADPQAKLTMNLTMFYTNPKHRDSGMQLKAERLSATCEPAPQHPTTCTATFDENSVIDQVPPPEEKWHLGDYPDGTYFAGGSLSTTTAAAAPVAAKKLPLAAKFKKTPGFPDGDFLYIFRNPLDCSAPSLSKKKQK